MNIYRERAALVAFLAKIWPAYFAHNDPAEPDWAVLYVNTPAGQLSWHIAEEDRDLFPRVRVDEYGPSWDGHSTEEKYTRLSTLDPWCDMPIAFAS